MRLFGNKVFSEAGTNDLRREQTTYILFKYFLEEMEGIARTHSQLIILFFAKKQFLCYLLSVLYLCHDIIILINNCLFDVENEGKKNGKDDPTDGIIIIIIIIIYLIYYYYSFVNDSNLVNSSA